jgi:hypothetical protein
VDEPKEPVFYTFDLLWLDGTDLKDVTLIEPDLAYESGRCTTEHRGLGWITT